MWSEHVIVVSHRRSGTHLTIDSIRNNFAKYRELPYLNIDRLFHPQDQKTHLSVEELEKELNKGPRVLKTHLLPSLEIYGDQTITDLLIKLFTNAKKIYVTRDGQDVMVSLYNYVQIFDEKVRKMSFSEFIRTVQEFDPIEEKMNRVKFWEYHLQSWLEKPWGNMLVIRFENLRKNFAETLDKISGYIDEPRDLELTDIIQTKQAPPRWWQQLLKRFGIRDKKRGSQITAVAFRKGKVGESKETFSEADLEFFNQNGAAGTELLSKLND